MNNEPKFSELKKVYGPCLAAMGTAFRELGRFYGTLMMVFQTIIGWSLVLVGCDQRKKKVFD